MSEIDYLNDPLLETPDDRPRAERTPLLERAAEVLVGIEAFVRETGAEPVSAKGRSVRERMLANELAGLRASKRELAGLRDADGMGLVFGEVSDDTGEEIGRMQFRAIEYPKGYETIEVLHLWHMDFGSYKGQGIGRRCLELVLEHSGSEITASDDDGVRKDDGSHLIGDGLVFVARMRQDGLIS